MFKSKWILPVTLATAIGVSGISTTGYVAEAKIPTTNKVDYKIPLNKAAAYYYSKNLQPTFNHADAVTVLARSNYAVNKNFYTTYYNAVVKTVADSKGVLTVSAGSLSKTIIALNAIGKDPKNVAGYNLIAILGDKLIENFEKDNIGISNAIYTLMALEGANQDFPTDAKYEVISKKVLVDYLVSTQFANGGFSWSPGMEAGVSTDMTAMALIGLANFDQDPQVKTAIRKGLDYMAADLTDQAGYAPFGGNSADSQAQVILALTENGLNPKTTRDFIKNGHWAISNLLLNYDATNGYFKLTPDAKSANNFTTSSGVMGLAAYDRYATDAATYYDTEHASASSLKFDTKAPSSLKVNSLSNTTTTITGTTEPYATVVIYDGKVKIATVVTDINGKFSYKLATKLKAASTVKIYVTDLAANKSKAFSYKVADRLTPVVPKVSTPKKGAKTVTGTTTKGATAYVKVGSKTYKAVASKTTGKFTVKVPTLKAKVKLTVYAKKNNYKSKSVTVTVKSK